jgi:type III pantothenate kinase
MLLCIDVGNTNIVYGLFEGQVLRHQFRVESSRSRTSDEFAVVLSELLRLAGVEISRVTAAIIASVVPALTEPMCGLVKRILGCDALVVGPGIKSGMPILYENPKEVGADRIVNAVAAYEQYKTGLIVVDFGTATTFDCVSPKGEYLGGVISPGIHISADALFARAAKLPRVEIAKPQKAVGRNTLQSMQSGIVYGYVGLVDGLVRRLTAELGFPCTVVAPGGLSNLIAPLTGLRLLYEKNSG